MASNLDTSRKNVTATDIDKLRSLLAGTNATLLTPSDADYANSLRRWSAAAEKPAGVVIVPTTAEEISVALKYATDHDLDVAVKGGGHSSAGASSTDGGLLFDLGGMRKVTVDPERQLLYVQGGAHWGDVDDAAWEHRLATVGGGVHDTGVGGLTLGGGFGNLSGKYGLVIDNLVSTTTVLANGEIVTSSETENPDLFWGLRGAGHNFGVTTEFVIKAYPQKEVYCGSLVFMPTAEVIEKVVAAANEIFTPHETPEGMRSLATGIFNAGIGFTTMPPEGKNPILIVGGFVDGNEETGKKIMKPFLDLGPVANMFKEAPFPDSNKIFGVPYGKRASMKGATNSLPLRPEFVKEVFSEFTSFVEKTPDASNTMVLWEYVDPCTVASKSAGCFVNRGYHFNGLVMPMWTQPENDQLCRQWARHMAGLFKDELGRNAKAAGEQTDSNGTARNRHNGVLYYPNYDQYEDRARDIFGDNYPRLAALKKIYDPKNVFNKLFPITPAD